MMMEDMIEQFKKHDASAFQSELLERWSCVDVTEMIAYLFMLLSCPVLSMCSRCAE